MPEAYRVGPVVRLGARAQVFEALGQRGPQQALLGLAGVVFGGGSADHGWPSWHQTSWSSQRTPDGICQWSCPGAVRSTRALDVRASAAICATSCSQAARSAYDFR